MSRVRTRPETGNLYFDFHFNAERCREYTTLSDTTANRKRMQQVLDKIDAEITLGSFEYAKYFPNSKMLSRLPANTPSYGGGHVVAEDSSPLFKAFVETWWIENQVRWRHATREVTRGVLDAHLIPYFGEQAVHRIARSDILQFRAELAQRPGRVGNQTIAPKTVNHYMGILQMVMTEACERFGFPSPTVKIKRLKVPRKDIHPFTLDQVRTIIATVRADFQNYFTFRCFTGMRSGEVHGLKWKYIDFERRQILVRETYSNGRTEYTKTDGSQREVHMSGTVYDALKAQEALSRKLSEYVFCQGGGGPLDAHNVTNRVWYPLLRHLGFDRRRPYQLRHTCATLWLGAGENPEWIARQLGHTTTEMLFRVYSRFVPNLTRKDGSAFDRLVTSAMLPSAEPSEENHP